MLHPSLRAKGSATGGKSKDECAGAAFRGWKAGNLYLRLLLLLLLSFGTC